MQSLVIDIGNTRVKMALFRKDQLVKKLVLEELTNKVLHDWQANHLIDKAIYSISGKRVGSVLEEINALWPSIELTEITPVPLAVLYNTPHTLGKDRLAAAVGAHYIFPEKNVLVVDAGTCITYEWINDHGEYLGGNIAPGLKMRAKAMHQFTARLPEVEGDFDTDFWSKYEDFPIGLSTEGALRNGAFGGALMELEGIIEWSEHRFGKITVVLTGGDANFFVRNLKREIFARPDLVLEGLNKILQFND